MAFTADTTRSDLAGLPCRHAPDGLHSSAAAFSSCHGVPVCVCCLRCYTCAGGSNWCIACIDRCPSHLTDFHHTCTSADRWLQVPPAQPPCLGHGLCAERSRSRGRQCAQGHLPHSVLAKCALTKHTCLLPPCLPACLTDQCPNAQSRYLPAADQTHYQQVSMGMLTLAETHTHSRARAHTHTHTHTQTHTYTHKKLLY